MRTDAKAKQARMAAAQQRWYHTVSKRRTRQERQLKDTVLAVVLLVIAGVAAGAGI
jgi:hypothetical protein